MDTPLGKPTDYPDSYAPERLVAMPRAAARAQIGAGGEPPFRGEDVWNGYEFSWLGPRGAPRVAGLRFSVPADSPCIVESKSLKLYLNGFAQTAYDRPGDVVAVLAEDLSAAVGTAVAPELIGLDDLPPASGRLPGRLLDDLELDVDRYGRAPELLEVGGGGAPVADQAEHTHLFRSLCPVTGQPDWASVLVRYSGPAITPQALLRYLLSYRRHQAFHETTVEQIFLDLWTRCGCTSLLVAGFFQRRGGIDINPVRVDASAGGWLAALPRRLPRQ